MSAFARCVGDSSTVLNDAIAPTLIWTMPKDIAAFLAASQHICCPRISPRLTLVPVNNSLTTATAAPAAAGALAGTLLPGIRTRVRAGGQHPRVSENPGPVYPWPQPKQDAGGALAGVLEAVQKPFAR
jgi:hypothetical protein